jgi:hypothetical protein
MVGCGYICCVPFLEDGRGEDLPRGRTLSFIIGRICTALKQTMDKFDLMMKEAQPKQADTVFLVGKSACIIFSTSTKGLLQCSLDSFMKGKPWSASLGAKAARSTIHTSSLL